MTSRAFAPAHVSGVFAVHDEDADPLKRGSRGVGWSLEKGARAAVTRARATRVVVNGKEATAPVTRKALEMLAPGVGFEVDLALELPMGQGFGMSAAGTLAACLAACAEAGVDPERALEAAHRAEVTSGTGLGDAIGSWFGAGEIRIRPGCPPHGWALRVEPPADAEFLFCVVGDPIPTPSIIRDEKWKLRTRQLGDAAVDRVIAAKREAAWTAILGESAAFGKELGLMPDAMEQLGERLPPDVTWGQSMLGSTLWATGTTARLDEAEAVLRRAGTVLRCGVDRNGARLVRA